MYQFYILCATPECAHPAPLVRVCLANPLDTDSVGSERDISVNLPVVIPQVDDLASARAEFSILACGSGIREG